MDKDGKIALKAACIQAAATLVARYARDLYTQLANEPWDREQDAQPAAPSQTKPGTLADFLLRERDAGGGR